MHAEFANHWALALACPLLLACSVHDKTNYQAPPPPTETTSPTRFTVDSGVVTLGDDAMGPDIEPPVGGTPDAGAEPDLGPDLPRLPGLGTLCDLFIQGCGPEQACYPGSDGIGTCQVRGSLLSRFPCTPAADTYETKCAQGLTCAGGFCARLCHYTPDLGPASGQCTCMPLGTSPTVGVCL
jgi:hypothetical protein